MANKPPDGIFLWDVGLGLEQKKINIAPKTHCDIIIHVLVHHTTLFWVSQGFVKGEELTF